VNPPCKKSDVVFIQWLDAVQEWRRGQLEDVRGAQLATNVSIGWIVDENVDRLVLANGSSSTGEVDHIIIPTPNVLERVYVARPKKGQKAPPVA